MLRIIRINIRKRACLLAEQENLLQRASESAAAAERAATCSAHCSVHILSLAKKDN